MKEDIKTFTVRVNRVLLLAIMLIAGVFFRVGLAAWRREWLDWSFPPDQPWLEYACYFFFLFVPGIILVNCLWYLIVPPVMLRFDANGVTFGVGFRYRPRTIAWNYVERIGYGADVNMTMKDQFLAGACVVFREAEGIPANLPTGMGLGYAFRRLTLHWLYADRFSWTIVKHGQRLWRHYADNGRSGG